MIFPPEVARSLDDHGTGLRILVVRLGAFIRVAGGTAANYEVVAENGALTVAEAAALTVTADDKSKTYGAADPALTFTASGTLFYGDTYDVITGVRLVTATGREATAGRHRIRVADDIAANYDVAHEPGRLTVDKAPLTVTANDQAKTYGGAEPPLTYSPSGTLYYGDNYGVIRAVVMSAATGAGATAGTHRIRAAGGTADNYEIAHAPGRLTVGKAPLTVTADDQSKTYGGDDPALTSTASGTNQPSSVWWSFPVASSSATRSQSLVPVQGQRSRR